MQIFSYLYNKMLQWARHQHAPYYLFGLSFAESSIFPIPPDVMLAPMALAKPQQAWTYAGLTTIASVLGGIVGYFIGALAFDMIHPYIIQWGYETQYLQVQHWFSLWGVVLVFFTGFMPIPYKFFTVTAGAMHIALVPFIIGSAISRGTRFCLVTYMMLKGGERMEAVMARYIERIGWTLLALLLFAYLICYHHPFHF